MHRTRTNRTRNWAPRTLAVLSFALAMLAAQPAAIASEPGPHGAVVFSSAPPANAPQLAHTPANCTQRRAATVEATRSDVRLHLLATVEILHRLIVAELQVRPVGQALPFVICFEPVYLGSIAPAITTPEPRSEFTPPPPLASERTFAIVHLLLAPPVV